MREAIWMGGTAVCALAFLVLCHSQGPWVRRSAFAAGLLALAALELLGIIWPSAYTVAGLIALPCAFVFLAGLARPHLMARRWVVIYGSLAVLLAALSQAFQAGVLRGLDAREANTWRPPLTLPQRHEP